MQHISDYTSTPKILPNPRKPLEAQDLTWKRRYYSGGKFRLNMG